MQNINRNTAFCLKGICFEQYKIIKKILSIVFIIFTIYLSPTTLFGATLDKTNCVPGSIGGSVNVSPTGGASSNISIQVPPGSHGVQPNLSIIYNSQSGNDVLGYGWHLSGLSAITRVSKNPYYDNTTAPVTLGSSDVYSYDGQRLISTGSNTYAPENDPYTVVQFNTSTNSFTVTTKDGNLIEYGNDNGVANHSKFYPKSSGIVYSWAISKMTDVNGNYITYTYIGDNTTGEYDISRINYTGNASTAPYNYVQFTYTSRTDLNTIYIGGYAMSETNLLSSIKTYAEGTLANDYEFTYTNDGQYTKLNQVGLTSNGTKFNPTIISWGSVPDFTQNQTAAMSGSPIPPDQSGYTHITGDMNGDGLQDIAQLLTSYPMLQLLIQQPNGSYNTPSKPLRGTVGTGPGDNYQAIDLQVVDLNNDGKAEILVHYLYYVTNINGNPTGSFSHRVFAYTYNNGAITENPSPVFDAVANDVNDIFQFFYGDFNNNGTVDRIVTQTIQYQSPIVYDINIDGTHLSSSSLYSLTPNDIRMLDFDGDGKIEILTLDNSGNGSIYKYSGSDFADIYDGTFAKPSDLFMGDLNGDGKTDYVKYNNGWSSYYSTGTGFIAGTNPMPGNTYDPATTASRMVLTDVNGDGKDDIVYAYNNTEYILLSKGTSFSSSVATFKPTSSTGMAIVNLIPLQQVNGQPGIVYVDNVTNLFLLTKFSNQLNSNLLVNNITDGNNNVSAITYDVYHDLSSTELIFPLRVFRGPMWYAKNVNVSYGQSNSISSVNYTLGKGIMHLQGKGFLGFMSVSSSDPVTGASNTASYNYIVQQSGPTLYSNWLQTATNSKNGYLISTATSNAPTLYGGNVSNFANKLFLPLTTSSTSTNNMTNLSVTNTVVTFDNAMGRVTDQKSVTSDGWVTETLPSYTVVSGNKNRLTQVITKRTFGGDTYTNTATYTYGNASYPFRVTSTSQGKVTTNYTDFDSYGNIKATTFHLTVADAYSTPDRSSSTTYDSYGRFILSTTDVDAGLTSSATYRATDGGTLTKTDPNGLVTTFNYSSGGNAQWNTTTLPDGNVITSTTGWDLSGTGLYYAQKQVTNGNTVTDYFNAYGQKLKETSLGFNSAVMTTTWTFNNDGTVHSITPPGLTSTPETFTYDGYGRILTDVGLNKSISYSYNYNNVTVTDNILKQSKTTYNDALGNFQLINSTTGNITYSYFGSGKVKSIITGTDTTKMTYDPVSLDQLTLKDPDAGLTTYAYNGFGQLKTQTDAKRQTTTCVYDNAGRLTSKTATGLSVAYTFSSTAGTKGLVTNINRDNGTVTEAYTYDALCRTKTITTIGKVTPAATSATNFVTTYTYNTAGQVGSIAYPSGLTVNYVYDAVGNLKQINNAAGGAMIWGNAVQNEMGQWAQFSLGNGITTNWNYNSTTKMLSGIQSGYYASVQNLGYNFNSAGQLLSRSDVNQGLTETFTYDAMDRLKTSQVGSGTIFTNNYNDNGNINSTTLASTYTYGNTAHPHAVTAISGPANTGQSPTSINTTATYNPENKVLSIDNATYHDDFVYGVDGNRFRVDFKTSGTVQSSKVYVGNSEFNYIPYYATNIYKRTIIYAPTGVCAVYQDSAGIKTLNYVHTDYQGSWLAITDGSGTVKNRYSYDAWGRPRIWQTWLLKNVGITTSLADLAAMQPRFDRGYTGHEMIANFALINMNGRLYDPSLQRFLSPDNHVQSPYNSQSYNRYSYCMNNPLRYTDPSGYTWFSRLGNWMGHVGSAVAGIAVTVGVSIAVGAIIVASGGTLAPLALAAICGASGGLAGGIFGTALAGGSGMDYVKAGIGGAIAGGLGGFAGSWASSATKALGAIPGAFAGGIAGGFAGGAAGGLAGGINNVLFGGGTFGDGFESGFNSGFISGAIGGAIGGGIRGYQLAQKLGANPWTGAKYVNERSYYSIYGSKSGIGLQSNYSRGCYANALEYADAGHYNNSSSYFEGVANGADGADAGLVAQNSCLPVTLQGHLNDICQYNSLGSSLQDGAELMGAIDNGVNHWVDITSITVSDKANLFFGGYHTVLNTTIWDPSSGFRSYWGGFLKVVQLTY